MPICIKILSNAKTYYTKRHYKSCHKIKYKTYDNEEKSDLLRELKLKHAYLLQKHVKNTLSSILSASFTVALLIAREKKSFFIGNLIKKRSHRKSF